MLEYISQLGRLEFGVGRYQDRADAGAGEQQQQMADMVAANDTDSVALADAAPHQ